MSFSRSDVSAKKHMARVSDLYRERVRSIKTVLFFIVSVSLLSGETVPTKWRPCQDKSGNRGKSGESNPKQIESTAADERKHTQDCWKQFAETDSKTSQADGEQS